MNDKLSKNELIYNLKEKEYQNQLLNKDRLLMKSSDIVNKNSYEVMEDIKKLKEEIKYFQNKANNNNINNIHNKYKNIIKEKIDLEDVIIKQEDKIIGLNKSINEVKHIMNIKDNNK